MGISIGCTSGDLEIRVLFVVREIDCMKGGVTGLFCHRWGACVVINGSNRFAWRDRRFDGKPKASYHDDYDKEEWKQMREILEKLVSHWECHTYPKEEQP